jgi:HD superfamily phosphodiesterase
MRRHAEAVDAAAASGGGGGSAAPAAVGGGGPGQPPRGRAAAAGPASLNHFGEKLLTLKGRMKTAAGRRLAERRHAFMEAYLAQLCAEVAGDA